MRISTKQTILEAFNALLLENHFDKITIEMIAKRSKISKATFYRYFLDKYDVMNYSYRRLVENAFARPECKSWETMYVILADMAQKDSVRIRKAYSSQGVNSYSAYLFSFSYDTVEKVIKSSRSGAGLTEEERCRLTHFCYGTVGLFYSWVNGDFSFSPETLGQYLYEAMPESLRNQWISPGDSAALLMNDKGKASHPTKGFSLIQD